jgi:isoquinoline 1-oxidoreductase beta subunit
MNAPVLNFSRRGLFQVAAIAGAGFAIGCTPQGKGAAAKLTSLGDFIRIGSDNTVTIWTKHIEFGQGSGTGLATIIAEELDAAWDQVRFESAPGDADKYWNTAFGDKFKVQGTGGSTAMANSWDQHRKAGAAARAMLVGAAAQKWNVKAEEITVENGVIKHGDKTATFGELADAAAKIAPPAPDALKLKDPSQFKLIGKVDARLDGAAKTDGTAIFTQDFKLPGMLTAVVARPPKFGATAKSVDDSAAKAVKGVVAVVQIPRGVAVVADGMWAALKGREALKIEWDFSKAETRSSDQLFAEYKSLLAKPGIPVVKTGAGAAALNGLRSVRATYEFPYLVHAPMETLDVVVDLKPGKSIEIWGGLQMPSVDRYVASKMTGLKPEQVTVHVMLAGGSFGRRATTDNDILSEGVAVAMAMGGKAPIKLVWTREDDVKGGRYRPMVMHDVAAGVNGRGDLVAWRHRVVGQPIILGTPFAPPDAKWDFATVGGIIEFGKAGPQPAIPVPNFELDVHHPQVGVPVLWWRSVEHTHTAYVMETMIDEIARVTRKDPFAFRQTLYKDNPRFLAVLDLLDQKAGPAPTGRGKGRGMAIHESFNTVVAQVVDVTIAGGELKIDRVVCAVDCGVAINPNVIVAQMEGGIGYGLSAILGEALTLADGEPVQSNFTDYPVLRMAQSPGRIEVHIVPSANPPTGVGEPGTPPIGPALANAVAAVTGKRIRKLPFGAAFA